MHIEWTVGLRSAHSVKGQGLVNALSCEVTVSKVRGEWPVCRAAVTPDRLIVISPIAQSANLLRWPAKENWVEFQALKSRRRGDHFD